MQHPARPKLPAIHHPRRVALSASRLALAGLLGCAALSALLGAIRPAAAQTLAHRGWAGSGLNADPWWQDAVFYEVDPALVQTSHDDTEDNLAPLIAHLDYIKSLDVDAIVLTPYDLAREPAATPAAAALETAHEESFNALIGEAGRRHLRILVDLPLDRQSTDSILATARFWFGRGVAGLRLTLPQPQTSATGPAAISLNPADIIRIVRDLRAVCTSYAGERVLLWDNAKPFSTMLADADSPIETLPHTFQRKVTRSKLRRNRRHRHQRTPLSARRTPPNAISIRATGPQLEVEDDLEHLPALNAMGLRATLIGAGLTSPHPASLPVLITDAAGHARGFDRYPALATATADPSLAAGKLLATVLFTAGAVPMLYFGQEIGLPSAPPAASAPLPDQAVAAEDADSNSLLNFYRRLSSLHHSNPALREGSLQLLTTNQPDIVAWVRSVRGGGTLRPPVVVVCNLSTQPQVVSLDADLRRIGFRQPAGSSLRTLAVSRAAATGVSADTAAPAVATSRIPLEPHGVFVAELRAQPGLEHTSLPHRRRIRHHH